MTSFPSPPLQLSHTAVHPHTLRHACPKLCSGLVEGKGTALTDRFTTSVPSSHPDSFFHHTALKQNTTTGIGHVS